MAAISYTLDTIDEVVPGFWAAARSHSIITFSGDMGAGKTTFISALCRHLGVEDAVSSPTFALVNEYRFGGSDKRATIYHIDWYRLRDTAEAVQAGMEDYIAEAERGTAYCFIEWPEKAAELLPAGCLAIYIETTGPEERRIVIG